MLAFLNLDQKGSVGCCQDQTLTFSNAYLDPTLEAPREDMVLLERGDIPAGLLLTELPSMF